MFKIGSERIKMATKKNSAKRPSKKEPASDPSVSYNEWKFYEGQFYKGMKVGRSHKWYYDKGIWRDKKITPDLWEIHYAVTKRRVGHAPKGSGVPVGTNYHWYIVAHQMVEKLNADDYTTSISGLKYKVAYKKPDTDKWSATPKTQRKRMIKFLQEMIDDLQQQEDDELKMPETTLKVDEISKSKKTTTPGKNRHAEHSDVRTKQVPAKTIRKPAGRRKLTKA
jgi:hypothetical protein